MNPNSIMIGLHTFGMIATVTIGFLTLTRMKSENRGYFVLFMFSVSFFSLGFIIEAISTSADGGLIGKKVGYIGSMLITPMLLAFIQKYCEKELPKPVNFLVFASAFAIIILVWTIGSHTLFYVSYWYDDVSPVHRLANTRGVLYPLGKIHPAVCMILSLYLLIGSMRNTPALKKKRIYILMYCAAAPAAASLASLFNFTIFNWGAFQVIVTLIGIFAVYFGLAKYDLIENREILIIKKDFLARLEMAKNDAENANRSKSSFLARMSHEIRTPMNAIVGMAELALREKLSPAVYEQVSTIKQSGVNLLSIVNDILDFSKIESGKLEIVPADYLFSSLLNDVISIIRMRTVDSQIKFAANVDSSIPNALTGDETRLRQILLNILSNAVKYTDEGYVSLVVMGEPDREAGVINLVIEVADSGRGMKPEDLDKLFGDFVRLDAAGNKGIEGTGLGLAITRSLVRAMGGDISVESEYGRGSTFIVTLSQKVRNFDRIASVRAPEGKSVLVYETREIFANSIVCSVDNLGVDCTTVYEDAEFIEKLKEKPWPFVFIASALYENVKEACLRSGAKIALLTEFGETAADKSLSTLAMPVHSILVANILNEESGNFSYNENRHSPARFSAPGAKVLVVDDINTNLKVAEGLLLPYQMQVTFCRSGMEAIAAVRAAPCDLVLMDQMMPEMDGVEAVKQIRALDGGQYLPVVALTANTVSGAEEALIQSGFDDFLSKPIDTVKLDALLAKWIPKEKQKTPGA